MPEDFALYGVAAEYDSFEALLAGAHAVRQHGHHPEHVDVLSAVPIEGADEALPRTAVLGFAALAGIVLGGCACFGMCVAATVVSHPFNVGGRPVFSWPSYVVPSFAAAMAAAGILVTAAMLFLNRLPRLNHPVFNIDGIDEVTRDRLFLVVERRSNEFDPDDVRRVLAALPDKPIRVQEVTR